MTHPSNDPPFDDERGARTDPASSADPHEAPALWPSSPVDLPPPGFVVEDESHLVPPAAMGAEDPVAAETAHERGRSPTPFGRAGARRRLGALGPRLALGAAAAAGVALCAAVLTGSLGIPPADGGQHAPIVEAPVAEDSASPTPDGALEGDRSRRGRAATMAPRPQRERGRVRSPGPRKPRATPAPPAAAPARPTEPAADSPDGSARAAPSAPSQRWADAPGPVREFEPGPWTEAAPS